MTETIPAGVITVADYARLAAERLAPSAAAYLLGGAGDELTARENREAFDRLRIFPRPPVAMAGAHTRVRLFGRDHAHPVLLAPVAYQRLAHPEGECATARAAQALDTTLVVSTLTTRSLEDIADSAPGAPRWFQLYVRPDRDFTDALVRRAEAHGCEALVITLDAPIGGLRHREHRAGFRLPAGVTPVLLADEPHAPVPIAPQEASPVFAAMRHAPSWDDVARLRGVTRLPILIKGLLHPDDATRALELGADGIIVSNHGGRVLDGVPPAIAALPAVAARVAGRAPVLLDGGVTRGGDIFKALALGATATLIGRPQVCGLAVAGALGVAHTLKLLREELEVTMALAGCTTPADITPARIHRD